MSQEPRPSPRPPLPTGLPDDPVKPMPGQAEAVNTNPSTYSEAQIQESINGITQVFPYITEWSAKSALLHSGGKLPGAIKLLLGQRTQGGNFDVPDDTAPAAKRAKGKGLGEAIELAGDASSRRPPAKRNSTGEVFDLTNDGSPSPTPLPRARARRPETFTYPAPNTPLFPSHLPRVRVKEELFTIPTPRKPLSPSPQIPKSESSYDTIDLASSSPPAKQRKGAEKVTDSTSKGLSFATGTNDKYYLNMGFRSPVVQNQANLKRKTYVVGDKCMHVLLSASETYSRAANKAALNWVKEQDRQLRKIMRTKSSPRDGVELILYKCVERLEGEAKTLVREDMQRLVHGITKVAEVKILKGSEKQEVNEWKVLPLLVGKSELGAIIKKEYLRGDGEAALTNFVELWERKSDKHRLTWGSGVALAKDIARVTKTLHRVLILDVEYTHIGARGNISWDALLQDYES